MAWRNLRPWARESDGCHRSSGLRPVVAGALASCDFATLMEEIRLAHGWTQHQLASAVGYSQSWVSNVLRRRQALTVDQVRKVSRLLEVPVHLLRFADPG